MDLSDKVILVTGRTGSFGKKSTGSVLQKAAPRKLIILSRSGIITSLSPAIPTGTRRSP